MYYPFSVKLSSGQMIKLGRAIGHNYAITIRLSKNELSGPDELMLTKTQINKIKKSVKNGVGTEIRISKAQIGKIIKKRWKFMDFIDFTWSKSSSRISNRSNECSGKFGN